MPRVTVFIPVYNTEGYIGEAIDSVLAQTWHDFELLIIDDGSTDSTPGILTHYADMDARVRVVLQPENVGPPATRNHALDLARGEYIAFLDADDRCASQRLERQVAYLDTHADIAGVGSWMTLIDEHGQPSDRPCNELPVSPDQISCQMLVECPLAHPTLLVRTTAFSHYRYASDFPAAEDYELWTRMIATCRFANLPEPLVFYRRHAGQITTTQAKAQKASDVTIIGQQVTALGLHHDAHDLVRHECLFKLEGRRPVLERTGAPLDIEYLRWARDWLEALLEANTRHRIYPEPALSRMVAARWLFACRKAARNSSIQSVTREFFGSSLRRAVFPFVFHRLKTFFKRDPPAAV